MRANINVEFTEEDLKKYAEEVGRRWVVNTLQEVIGHLNKLTPEASKGLKQVVGEIVRSAAAIAMTAPDSKPEHVEPEVVHRGRPDKCQRTGDDGGMLDDGWVCCRCGTYNGLHRPACRDCKHERCDIVVTPPPGTPSGSA